MPRAKIKKKKEIYIFFFKKSSNTAIIKARKKTIRTIEKKTGKKKKLGKSLSVSGVDRCCRSSIVSFFSVLFFFVFVLAFDAGVGARVKQSNGVCRVVMDRSANQRPAIAADCLAPYFSLLFVFLFVFFWGVSGLLDGSLVFTRETPMYNRVTTSQTQSNPVKFR